MATNISTITINASAGQVWDTITKPELVKLWQYGSELHTNWQPGSDIRFITRWEDKVFEQWGKVITVTPFKLIKYSLFAARPGLVDKPEHYFIMNYVLTAGEEYTTLEIIQEDNRPGAVQEAPQGEENPVLMELKRIAETAAG